jgi:hypothetical protein
MDILANHEGSLLRVPFETTFARGGNERLEEMIGQPNATEFDKLMVHLDGFLTAAEFIFCNSPELRAALLAPIARIFSSEYRVFFPRFAGQFGKTEISSQFLVRLDNALRF